VADNRAQYAIDIAARLTGGSATFDQLDTLTSSLMTGGKEADFFAAALSSVDASLKSAAAATLTANAALEAGVAAYKDLESAALQAAKAAERAALKNGGLVPAELFAESEKAKTALDAHAQALKGLESAAKSAKDEEARLGSVQRNLVKVQGHVGKSLAASAEQSGKLKEAIGSIGGPLGSLGQKILGPIDSFNKLSQTFGSAQAKSILLRLGLLAVVAGSVLLAAAAAAGVVAMASWGVSLADTARNAGLANEAFLAANPTITGYSEAAERAAAASGLTSEALRGLAAKLTAAKVSAANLPDALEAAAIAERALGSAGSDKFVESIKAGTKSVEDLAKATKASLGGIVAKQLLSLDSQATRFKASVGRTFGGLRIDPLLEGFQTLGRLFDADTASGKALKTLFEGFFQPLVDGFANAVPAIESFFLGIEIGLLKLQIFLKPVSRWLKEAFGFEDRSTENTLAAVAKAGEYMSYVFAGLIPIIAALAVVTTVWLLALATPFIIIAAKAALVVGAVALVGAALYGLYQISKDIFGQLVRGVEWVASSFGQAFGALTSLFTGWGSKLFEVGAQVARGFADGITAGASAIVAALTGAVRGAIDSAKRLLGIASPSKVFMEIGDHTVAGYSEGVDAAAPMAQASVAEALEPPNLKALDRQIEALQLPELRLQTPDAPELEASASLRKIDLSAGKSSRAAPAENTASSSSSSTDNSRSISLSNVTFQFQGVQGAEDAEQSIRTTLFKILNGELSQAGGAA
jgi:hypothetical protein